MIEVLNELGLDYVALGNHEVEVGSNELGKRIEESNFTWLCANVIDPSTNKIYKGFKDYEIKMIDGLKVAFFGLLTKDIYQFVKKVKYFFILKKEISSTFLQFFFYSFNFFSIRAKRSILSILLPPPKI